MARIYLASSWRNDLQPGLVTDLNNWGHAVYDFRNPPNGIKGFSWSDLDARWHQWGVYEYVQALTTNPRAAQGFISDLRGMEWADTCVLLLPSGRSAHIEAGWMKGRGKRCVIYLPNEQSYEPELMYLLADAIVGTLDGLEAALR